MRIISHALFFIATACPLVMACSSMLWITIAVALAVPVGVVLARRFLQDYPERISGYWWIFVVAVLLVLVISFSSVLWQTLKAARTSPAVELKKE